MTTAQLTRRESDRQALIRQNDAQQAAKVRRCLAAWERLTRLGKGHPDAKDGK